MLWFLEILLVPLVVGFWFLVHLIVSFLDCHRSELYRSPLLILFLKDRILKKIHTHYFIDTIQVWYAIPLTQLMQTNKTTKRWVQTNSNIISSIRRTVSLVVLFIPGTKKLRIRHQRPDVLDSCVEAEKPRIMITRKCFALPLKTEGVAFIFLVETTFLAVLQ